MVRKNTDYAKTIKRGILRETSPLFMDAKLSLDFSAHLKNVYNSRILPQIIKTKKENIVNDT
jgi:hypothetical protein